MQFFKKRDAILYQSKLDKKKDIYLFAKDKNETGAKLFYINSMKNVYNLILKGKNNFYEFWTESQELKFSLDIDFENTEKNANKIVKNICKFVISELKEFHPNYSFSDVIILKSLPTDIKQNSFHIIFDKVKFKNHKHSANG